MDVWSWREFLSGAGIDPGPGVAGFSGSLVRILQMRLRNPARILAQAASGTLIAVYLGKLMSGWTTISIEPASFLIGYLGIEGLEYVLNVLRQRLLGDPKSPPSNGEHKDA